MENWYIYFAANETDILVPKHKGFPWAVANKQYTEETGDEIINDLFRWACQNYDGEKIAACQAYKNQQQIQIITQIKLFSSLIYYRFNMLLLSYTNN
ncbi:unnamed protein product [Paramecium octaurelia]|uniref:Uncharacterized protein n=1 Tax=Paramecium octaurelia TaxID=43137 RepID=A0A8S1SS25_PAROT|nr:unnamed protein product [Paramecium octaurelia]